MGCSLSLSLSLASFGDHSFLKDAQVRFLGRLPFGWRDRGGLGMAVLSPYSWSILSHWVVQEKSSAVGGFYAPTGGLF